MTGRTLTRPNLIFHDTSRAALSPRDEWTYLEAEKPLLLASFLSRPDAGRVLSVFGLKPELIDTRFPTAAYRNSLIPPLQAAGICSLYLMDQTEPKLHCPPSKSFPGG